MTRKLEEYRIDSALTIPEETVQLWKQIIKDSKKRCKELTRINNYMLEIIKNHENK